MNIHCIITHKYSYTGVLPTQKGRQGSKVKRLSSLIELRDLNGQSELTTPTKRLHPQIKQGIEAYKYSQFRLVNTEEKNWMPTAEGKGCGLFPSNSI